MTDFCLSYKGSFTQLENPQLLKDLSRKEAERFNEYVMANDPWFEDGGLSKVEIQAVAGYIYQKTKGHIDAFHDDTSGGEERQDGS